MESATGQLKTFIIQPVSWPILDGRRPIPYLGSVEVACSLQMFPAQILMETLDFFPHFSRVKHISHDLKFDLISKLCV